jgi:hypothetical protein
MRHSKNEKKISKKKDLREFRPQRKRKNILTAVRKSISRENIVFSKLIAQKQTITEKNEAEELKKNFNSKDLEKFPAAEIQIKSSLR